jgi:hypothetical protein
VIAPAYPGVAIGGGEQGLDLLAGGKEADQGAVEALVGDGEYSLDYVGVFGVAQRGLSAVDDYPQWTGRRIRIPLQGRRLAL